MPSRCDDKACGEKANKSTQCFNFVENSPSSLNIQPFEDQRCFVATLYLPDWNDNANKERELLCTNLDVIIEMIKTQPIKHLAFDLCEVDKVKWPGNRYLNEVLASIQRNKPLVNLRFFIHSKEKFKKASTKINEWCFARSKYTANNKIPQVR